MRKLWMNSSNVLTDCETFIYSFRLAAKIMIDVLTDGQMREI